MFEVSNRQSSINYTNEGEDTMVEVNVSICGILLYCDPNTEGFDLGEGYKIKKIYLDELSIKDRITSANGQLNISYMGSRLEDNHGVYFMCLCKEDKYNITEHGIVPGIVYTWPDKEYDDQISDYKGKQTAYINKVINLLRVFKEGNIGLKETFFVNRFHALGIMNNTENHTNDNVTRNIIDTRTYSLSENEKQKCSLFIRENKDTSYNLLRNIIYEFSWGLEQTDIPTGLEQYTTALEMLLLEHNEEGKKQKLAKRSAVLIGSNPVEIGNIYQKMLDFYRYRSESLHDGNGQNITNQELHELENIVRLILHKYLEICRLAYYSNSSITWEEIKAQEIVKLKGIVKNNMTSGILPS